MIRLSGPGCQAKLMDDPMIDYFVKLACIVHLTITNVCMVSLKIKHADNSCCVGLTSFGFTKYG